MSHTANVPEVKLQTPASGITDPVDAASRTIDELALVLSPELLITDPVAMEPYQQDRAFDPDAGMPMAVVLPRTTEHVQATMQWAAKYGIPVVPRGAGTGLSGGATAVHNGIVLSTERMRNIQVDVVTRTAVVQPGLLNAEVKAAAAQEGLWYPPDPASYEIAPSAATLQPMPAACAASNTASPLTTSSGWK